MSKKLTIDGRQSKLIAVKWGQLEGADQIDSKWAGNCLALPRMNPSERRRGEKRGTEAIAFTYTAIITAVKVSLQV